MNKNQLSQQIWEKTSGWIDGIGTVVNQLAKQLGVAAAHVYEVYTRQMFVEGITYAVFSITIAIASLIVMVKSFKWSKGKMDSDDRSFVLSFAVLAGLGIFFGMIFGLAIPNIMKAANPEYYTMKEIFDMVKSATGK